MVHGFIKNPLPVLININILCFQLNVLNLIYKNRTRSKNVAVFTRSNYNPQYPLGQSLLLKSLRQFMI